MFARNYNDKVIRIWKEIIYWLCSAVSSLVTYYFKFRMFHMFLCKTSTSLWKKPKRSLSLIRPWTACKSNALLDYLFCLPFADWKESFVPECQGQFCKIGWTNEPITPTCIRKEYREKWFSDHVYRETGRGKKIIFFLGYCLWHFQITDT